MTDEEKKAYCINVFTHEWAGGYRSRSIAGMENCLIQKYKFDVIQASNMVQDFITLGIIEPTQTNDQHYQIKV